MFNITGFSNSHPITNGQLRFLNKQVFKMGKGISEISHKFREIKLADGSPLKLSPDDYILQFRLIRGSQNGKSAENVFLPASLFTQARKTDTIADTILFTLNGENFALELSPCLAWWSDKIQTYSFNDCFKGIVGQGCTAISMYLDEADIPTQEGHIRWGDVIELSPKAQRLEIGKKGCVPTNYNDLMLSLKPVDKDAARCEVNTRKEEDRFILFVGQPGFSMESQDSLINVDLIVDSNRLYLHSYQKTDDEFEPVNIWGIRPDVNNRRTREKFYWMNLIAGPLQINEDEILVTYIGKGVMRIDLPYLKKQEIPIKESNKKNDTEIDQQTKEIGEKEEILFATLALAKQEDFESNPDKDPPMGNESIERSQTTTGFDQNYQNSDEDYHIEEISSNEGDNNGYCKIS